MLYECFIRPGFHSKDIEANSAEEAKTLFVDMIRESLEEEHVIANNLDTDDGVDPKVD